MLSQIIVEDSETPFESSFAPDPRLSAGCKRVLVISGGNQGKLAQYRQIYEQGIRIVVLDAPDHWSKACLKTGLVEAFIEVDLTERASLFDDVIAALMDSGLLFDEVIAFSDSAAGLTARLAYAMGLSDHFDVRRQ
jgi:hypothetical protein